MKIDQKRLLGIVPMAGLLVLIGMPGLALGQEQQKRSFTGKYRELRPAQQRVAEEWYRRAQQLGAKGGPIDQTFEGLPLSVRATFDAVTHALLTTRLTSAKTGASMGNALDLVEFVDEVAGEVPGARGDQQFRIYVYLKPGVVAKLTESKEFGRSMDNTIYHAGYPICFRLRGGVPSIQISIARNERSADIDVDYRSSKFPTALVNGHLSSSNSDVRAGNNVERHSNRWQGLSAWWRNLFGFADLEAKTTGAMEAIAPAGNPAKIHEAVDDFLRTWIVDRKPEVAAGYFSRSSFDCSPATGDRSNARQGLMRYRLALAMKKLNDAAGPVARVEDVVGAVALWDSRLQEQQHPNPAAYRLAKVPDFLAAKYLCSDPDASVEERARKNEYFASVMEIKKGAPADQKTVVYFLWAKEGGRWRIAAFESGDAAQVTKARAALAGSADQATRVTADLALIAAVKEFHTAWLVENDSKKALDYLEKEAFGCVAEETGSGKLSDKEARRRILVGMDKTVAALGKKATLEDAVRNPGNPSAAVRIVGHSQENAFLLIQVPDQFAAEVSCGKDVPIWDRNVTPVFGNNFVSAIQLRVEGEPAALWMLWHKSDKGWKSRYWKMVVP